MPEDRERSAALRGAVEQAHELRLGALCRQAEVPLLGERGIHGGERNLEEVERFVAGEAPGAEWMRDAGAEADGFGEPERGVVAEAQFLEVGEVRVRVDAE